MKLNKQTILTHFNQLAEQMAVLLAANTKITYVQCPAEGHGHE